MPVGQPRHFETLRLAMGLGAAVAATACMFSRPAEPEGHGATDDLWGARTVDHAPPDAVSGGSALEDAPDYSLPLPAPVASDDALDPEFEIPENPAIDAALDRYTTVDRAFIERALDRVQPYWGFIMETLNAEGLPRELAAIALIESGFNSLAASHAGAAGMWQFMSGTGRMYGLDRDWWVDERQDFAKATSAAARHLSDLHGYYKRWPLVIAAYNAGMGKINNAVRRYDTNDYWELRRGRYLRQETKDYVPRFYAATRILENPALYGFDVSLSDAPVQYDYVDIPDATDLRVVADAAELDLAELEELNPELRRWCTPPANAAKSAPYRLRLPAGTAETFNQAFAAIPPERRVTFRRHKVRAGETPSHLAKRYGTSAKVLLAFNHIASPRHLRAGKTIVVPVRGDGGPLQDMVEPPVVAVAAPRRIPAAGHHVVRPRETLWSIARRYGLAVSDLLAWNGLEPDSLLRPGDRVRLVAARSDSNPSETKTAARSHVLRHGETIESVARTHHMDATLLAMCNAVAVGAPPPPGRSLTLCDEARDPARKPDVHVVSAGESLASIARAYKVTASDLRDWNGLPESAPLEPGLHLRVAGKAAP